MKRILYITSAIILNTVAFNVNAASSSSSSAGEGFDAAPSSVRVVAPFACAGEYILPASPVSSYAFGDVPEDASTTYGLSASSSSSSSSSSEGSAEEARYDIFGALEALATGEMTSKKFKTLLDDPEAIDNEQLSDSYNSDNLLAIDVALRDLRVPAEDVAAIIDAYPVIARSIGGYTPLITVAKVTGCPRRNLMEKTIVMAAINRANR